MAKRYLFGQDFTFTYYPIDSEGEAITADALTNAYLFSHDEKPTRAEAAAGTGALQTIGSWTPSGNGYQLSIDGVDDPEPTSDVYERSYWLGINYTLSSSEQVQTDLVEVILSRVVGYGAELSVTAADLQKYFPKIDSYLDATEQGDHIEEAASHVRSVLLKDKWEYWKVTEPNKLRFATTWRALQTIALGQISDGEEGFETLLTEAKEEYSNAMGRLDIELDLDLDGEPDTKQQLGTSLTVVI